LLENVPDLVVGGPPCHGFSVMDLFTGAGEVALSFYIEGIGVILLTDS
jgi:hypothetical protein